MNKDNELFVESINFYPREDDLDKYVLILTSRGARDKFFIGINRDAAEIVLPYINRLHDGEEKHKKNVEQPSSRDLLFDFYMDILKDYKCLINKVVISENKSESKGEICIRDKVYVVDIVVGIIVSLQFNTPLFITEESFLFNTNLLKKEVSKIMRLKNYTFKFSPYNNYSREFLLFLYKNSKENNDLELLYLLQKMLMDKQKMQFDEKDFF